MHVIDANTVFGGYCVRAVDASLERLLALMRRHAVKRAVTCSTTGIFYDPAPGNDETLAACAGHPELIPAGTVAPTKLGAAETVGRLAERGFRLLRLFNAVQKWPVRSFAPFDDVLAAADEALLPVMLDVQAQGDFTALAEAARRVNVPVIVCGCNYHHLAEAIAVARRTPNLYVELHQLTVPDGIEMLCRHVGADRVIYGSWAPLNYVGHTLMILAGAEVTDAERTAIAGGNIERILDQGRSPGEAAP